MKDSVISVDTNKHVVTRNGHRQGRAGRARASRIAKRTEGVRPVINRLTIGPLQGLKPVESVQNSTPDAKLNRLFSSP
jgi:osmotically-inducible protein OsmY